MKEKGNPLSQKEAFAHHAKKAFKVSRSPKECGPDENQREAESQRQMALCGPLVGWGLEGGRLPTI